MRLPSRRAFALALLAVRVSGRNIDAFRYTIERLDRAAYLDDGYFGRWLNAAEMMLTDSAVDVAPPRPRPHGPASTAAPG